MWGNSIIWPVVSGTIGPIGGFSKGLWVPWDTGTMGHQISVSIREYLPHWNGSPSSLRRCGEINTRVEAPHPRMDDCFLMLLSTCRYIYNNTNVSTHGVIKALNQWSSWAWERIFQLWWCFSTNSECLFWRRGTAILSLHGPFRFGSCILEVGSTFDGWIWFCG